MDRNDGVNVFRGEQRRRKRWTGEVNGSESGRGSGSGSGQKKVKVKAVSTVRLRSGTLSQTGHIPPGSVQINAMLFPQPVATRKRIRYPRASTGPRDFPGRHS